MSGTRYVSGAQKLGRRIATIRAAFSLPVLTQEIGALLVRRTQRRFDTERDPDERPWTALTKGTLRRREYKGTKILTQTGELRNSVRLIRGASAGGLAINTGAGVRVGFVGSKKLQQKARAQNYGLPGHIPARRILGISANDVKSVDGLLRRTAEKMER